MAHKFGLFVAQYLDETMNQARLADALDKDEAYVSRMLNKGQYIKSDDKGRHNIITVIQAIQDYHGLLTLKEVNKLLIELGKAPLNRQVPIELVLINSLKKPPDNETTYLQLTPNPQPLPQPITTSLLPTITNRPFMLLLLGIVIILLGLIVSQIFFISEKIDPLIREADTPQLVGQGATSQQSFIQAYELIGGYDLLGDPLIDQTNGAVQTMTVCGKPLEIQFFEGCGWCRPFALIWHSEIEEVVPISGSVLNTFLDADIRETQMCLPTGSQMPSLHEPPFRSIYGREGFYQSFELGVAYVTSVDGWRTHIVPTDVHAQLVSTGGLDGIYGFPISSFMDDFQRFENGVIALSDTYTEAEWVEQSPSPVQVAYGSPATVTVRFRNMGNEVWDERYSLRVQEPTYDAEKFACDNWNSPIIATALATNIEPNDIATFTFPLCPTHELDAGQYTPNWILFRGDAPVPNYRNGNVDNVTTAWWEVVVNED